MLVAEQRPEAPDELVDVINSFLDENQADPEALQRVLDHYGIELSAEDDDS